LEAEKERSFLAASNPVNTLWVRRKKTEVLWENNKVAKTQNEVSDITHSTRGALSKTREKVLRERKKLSHKTSVFPIKLQFNVSRYSDFFFN